MCNERDNPYLPCIPPYPSGWVPRHWRRIVRAYVPLVTSILPYPDISQVLLYNKTILHSVLTLSSENYVYSVFHTTSATHICPDCRNMWCARTFLKKYMYDPPMPWLRIHDISNSVHRSHHKSSFALISTQHGSVPLHPLAQIIIYIQRHKYRTTHTWNLEVLWNVMRRNCKGKACTTHTYHGYSCDIALCA